MSFRYGIAALGAEYWQADFALQLTWWYLYLVEFVNWDRQTAIGMGNCNSGSKINTGGTDSTTYHMSWAVGIQDDTVAVQYRNIENLWGNVSESGTGLFPLTKTSALITTRQTSKIHTTVRGRQHGAINGPLHTVISSYITAWGYDTYDPSFIYLSAVGCSWETYIPDMCDYYNGIRALYTGGARSNGNYAGSFSLRCLYTPDDNRGTSSRLQKLPRSR